MKKKLLAISLLVLCLSLCAAGTAAYFTATEKARNTITVGEIHIELEEKDADGNDYADPKEGLIPGETVDKVVTVKNTGSKPAWIRMSVEKAIELAEGETGDVDLDLIGIDFNETDWIRNEEDGFYYYKEALEPDLSTNPLFTQVTLDKAMDNTYARSTSTVTVQAQAVQADNNGSAVEEAKGWPEA